MGRGFMRKKHMYEESNFSSEKDPTAIQRLLFKMLGMIRSAIDGLRPYKWGLLVLLIAVLFSIFIYNSLGDEHSRQFFTYFEEYKLTLDLQDPEQKKQSLQKIASQSHKVCHTLIPTKYSYHSCLIEAIVYIQLEQADKSSVPLSKHADHYAGQAFGIPFMFYAGISAENNLNFEKAYEHYQQLTENLGEIGKEDISLFHKARVLYLQNKYDLSVQSFEDLLRKYPSSEYKEQTQSYIMMIRYFQAQKQ